MPSISLHVHHFGITRALSNVPFANVRDHLKGSLYAVLFNITRLHGLDVVLTRESQDVEGVLTGDSYQLAAIRPVNLEGKLLVGLFNQEILVG